MWYYNKRTKTFSMVGLNELNSSDFYISEPFDTSGAEKYVNYL